MKKPWNYLLQNTLKSWIIVSKWLLILRKISTLPGLIRVYTIINFRNCQLYMNLIKTAAIFHEKQTWNCLCFCKSFQRSRFCSLLSIPEPTRSSARDRDKQMSMHWFVVSRIRLHSADTSCSRSCLPWQILSLLNTINRVSIKKKNLQNYV